MQNDSRSASGSADNVALTLEEITEVFDAADVTDEDCRTYVRRWNDTRPKLNLDKVKVDTAPHFRGGRSHEHRSETRAAGKRVGRPGGRHARTT